MRRRPWCSIGVAVFVAVVSVVAWCLPALSDVLVTDSERWTGGQWWRLVTPVLVQPDGWGQLAFNTVGTVLVGAALERRVPRMRWLLILASGGIGTLLLLSAWRPEGGTGGSSNAVAALVGAVAVLWCRQGPVGRSRLDVSAAVYAVFFACYLSASAVGGAWPAVIVGNAALVVMAVLVRQSWRVVARVVLAVVVLAGVVMGALGDGHGWGLLIGVALAIPEGRTAGARSAGVPSPLPTGDR